MKNILLIISGSIAAYKSLELIRRLRDHNVTVTTILTAGGAQFITPLAVTSLSGQPTYTDLFSLKDETEMGHIRLSREADLILVAPASADLIAKMAHGLTDDLASAVLLAANCPVLVAPAMNPQMWQHPATQRNIAQLQTDCITLLGPAAGDMACGETGSGRMLEPEEILALALQHLHHSPSLAGQHAPARLAGKHAIVTAGPTFEPIDPVRFLGNRSSGKQGYAIAEALARAGTRVTLISGPTALKAPAGVTLHAVETAEQMWQAVESSLPADIFVGAAAVSDWRSQTPASQKIKKRSDATPPTLSLEETPDILARISQHKKRPALCIGFAAETAGSPEALEQLAQSKRTRKQCDWIIANDVSEGRIFGEEHTSALIITGSETTQATHLTKQAIARHLAEKIEHYFQQGVHA